MDWRNNGFDDNNYLNYIWFPAKGKPGIAATPLFKRPPQSG
jgi:hypothetical protein